MGLGRLGESGVVSGSWWRVGIAVGRSRKLGRRWRWVGLGTDPTGLGGLWTDGMGVGRLGESG